MSTLTATEPIIRARLKKARDKQYTSGVLGLRAQPSWDGDAFVYEGTPVTVVACPSVLSLWEAIDQRDPQQWTVVLTSVDDDDLGDTVLAHLLDGRLISPDPWDALRNNFAASTIEPALYRTSNDRAIANGLLSALSPDAYTPAPSGVLTRDHAMSAIARDVLKIVKDVYSEIDTLAVLEWSRSSEVADGLITLSSTSGLELSTAFQTWLADRSGRLREPVKALLASNRIADLVPLGVVAGLFGESDSKALGVFLGRYGLNEVNTEDLKSWYQDTRGLLTSSLNAQQQQAVLNTAASIVNELGITDAAGSSELLPQGLDARLMALSDAVNTALPNPIPAELDSRVISDESIRAIEVRWAQLQQHFLADRDHSVRAFGGAMRLLRWLGSEGKSAQGLAAAAERYVRVDSWVDTALITARRGADQPLPAAALRAVIDVVLARRASHDRSFATALADAPTPPVQTIENVMHDLVIPIAKKSSTLLVVVDALSMAATNDLVRSTQFDGWTEVSANNDARRASALAVLPTLTGRSRCSLLCGELRQGDDGRERSGFLSLLRDAQLEATGGVPDPIFHKKALDAVPSGAKLASDVRDAVADVTRQPLVAVVLNYVDDTLHHTDPGGTDWNLETITYLGPLLSAARNAGRTVVVTSDHGHIIEYGSSAKVQRAPTYGQRAHGDFANVDPDREVVVKGPRVLTETNKAVLAVDENTRYDSRNAGYHGGATPAEAIVPVVVLVAGELPEGATRVVGAEPPWWYAEPVQTTSTPVAPVAKTRTSTAVREGQGSFEFESESEVLVVVSKLPASVVRTAVFAQQLALAGRIVLQPVQIQKLLQALVDNSANEINLAQAATALGVATPSVNGALMQAKRVLDVEGYEVLRVGGGVVRLELSTLKEQFGVRE